MKPRHHVSAAAIALIKRFEGFRANAVKLDDGRWTIGFGHTLTARQGAHIDEADGEALLQYDLIAVAHAVNEWVYAPLTQNQFDALVSFVFNIGVAEFRHSMTLRRLNEGRMLEAAAAMELWRRADFEGDRIVIDALIRRRACEKILFLKPADAWPTAPTPLLTPRLDYDTQSVMPSQTPSVVKARLDGERMVADLEPPAPPPAPPAAPNAPTASELAAAGVSARLGAIFPESETPPARADDPFGDPPAPRTSAETAKAVSDARAAMRASPPVATSERSIAADNGAARSSTGSLVALAILGVVLFLAAILWGFKSPVFGVLLGWGLGGAGIACFAAAAYRLLAGPPEKDPRAD